MLVFTSDPNHNTFDTRRGRMGGLLYSLPSSLLLLFYDLFFPYSSLVHALCLPHPHPHPIPLPIPIPLPLPLPHLFEPINIRHPHRYLRVHAGEKRPTVACQCLVK